MSRHRKATITLQTQLIEFPEENFADAAVRPGEARQLQRIASELLVLRQSGAIPRAECWSREDVQEGRERTRAIIA
jgi:hypothetical protein